MEEIKAGQETEDIRRKYNEGIFSVTERRSKESRLIIDKVTEGVITQISGDMYTAGGGGVIPGFFPEINPEKIHRGTALTIVANEEIGEVILFCDIPEEEWGNILNRKVRYFEHYSRFYEGALGWLEGQNQELTILDGKNFGVKYTGRRVN